MSRWGASLGCLRFEQPFFGVSGVIKELVATTAVGADKNAEL
jgi:hypothetical protein